MGATEKGDLQGVVPGSPAEQAGLTAGDQILALDGQTVASPSQIVSILQRKAPGNKVTLRWVDSFGQRHSQTVTLALSACC